MPRRETLAGSEIARLEHGAGLCLDVQRPVSSAALRIVGIAFILGLRSLPTLPIAEKWVCCLNFFVLGTDAWAYKGNAGEGLTG